MWKTYIYKNFILQRGNVRTFLYASVMRFFSWRQCYPHTSFTYIHSKDIFRHNRCQKDEADVLMVKGKSWCDKNIKIVAAGSNDSGVSWIVEVAGKRIFHAGDLNNWYARFLTTIRVEPSGALSLAR